MNAALTETTAADAATPAAAAGADPCQAPVSTGTERHRHTGHPRTPDRPHPATIERTTGPTPQAAAGAQGRAIAGTGTPATRPHRRPVRLAGAAPASGGPPHSADTGTRHRVSNSPTTHQS